MGAGLIYAGIVAAWAVLLVPRWLARHDERAPIVPVVRPDEVARVVKERSTSTGRILDRRARCRRRGGLTVAASRSLLAGGRSGSSGAPSARRAHRQSSTAAGARPGRRREPAGRPRAGRPAVSPGSPVAKARPTAKARRRRAMLVLLVLITAGLGAAAGYALVPLWLAGSGVAALVGYFGQLRIEVRRARRRDRRQRLLARQAAARRQAVHAARRRGAGRRAEPPSRPVLVNPDGTWNPIPLPLPTYVTAPVIDRPAARVIDVSASGAAWTSGRLRTGPVAAPAASVDPADQNPLPDRDLPVEERRVANG